MDHRVASGATSPAYCTGIINTPLDAWKQAKVSFASLNGLDHNWGHYKPIVLDLGQSLKDLFGANHTSNGRTPYLKQYVDQIFPREKGWNLKQDSAELYARFERLDRIYNDLCSHFDTSKIERVSAALTYETLRELMATTREVWLWLLQKRAGSNPVAPDQLVEFAEDNQDENFRSDYDKGL